MSTTPASTSRAYVALTLLLPFLVACSSAVATDKPKQVIIIEKEVDYDCYVVEREVKAWIDANGNGEWDSGEEPLENAKFRSADVAGEAPCRDLHDVETSNEEGIAHVICCSACFPSDECEPIFAVYAFPPAGFKHTTQRMLIEGPYRFGFTYINTPIPEPTPTPRP